MTLKEAYEIIKFGGVGYTVEKYNKACGMIYEHITPPTADEVCKALSEYFKKDVHYLSPTKEFIFHEAYRYVTETYGDGLWTLSHYLPPHLITLIGRFYEVQDV